MNQSRNMSCISDNDIRLKLLNPSLEIQANGQYKININTSPCKNEITCLITDIPLSPIALIQTKEESIICFEDLQLLCTGVQPA